MVDAGLKEVVTNVERVASGNLWLVESPTDVAAFIELDDCILVVVDVLSCLELGQGDVNDLIVAVAVSFVVDGIDVAPGFDVKSLKVVVFDWVWALSCS